MTPEERAEKLLKIVASLLNYEPRLADPNYKAALAEIAAEIRAVAKIADEKARVLK